MPLTRRYGSMSSGHTFPPQVIAAVWAKAQVVPGYDPAQYRKDRCGAWIEWRAYGQTGERGWEIDHERPVALGGSDDLQNLQPLHWRNNRGKGDDYPRWSCTIGG